MHKKQIRLIDGLSLPEGIKRINYKQLHLLCCEIRDIIMETVSCNGGHLSSNLGVVELTVALHRVFDFKEDILVWDVGHQCYTHKILTGRMAAFHTIRKYGGISGFPKREESPYDFFNTGHSSTAISAACGFARSKTLKKQSGMVIAVVGDGAMTGGMAFEALNDAGSRPDNLLVILNDNEMSISKNVGSLPRYLEKIRGKTLYSKTNTRVRNLVRKIPLIGGWLQETIHRAKGAIKYFYTQEALFEEFGFRSYGPVDGHDIKAMEILFQSIKGVKGPKLIHVITKKGKGYDRAECNPHDYHGLDRFDVLNGVDKVNAGKSFSTVTGEILCTLAKQDAEIVVICPAMSIGSGLAEFAEKFPERFFDVGIAEQHGVTLAAGLACQGMKPVVVMYSSFMQRAYDQILHDVCLTGQKVVFCIDRAGIVPHDGETHQGIYDLAYLGHMPNMRIFAPSNQADYESMMREALYGMGGPVAIRYPKMSCPEDRETKTDPFQVTILRNGCDTCLFSYGRILSECLKAAFLLESQGVYATVVDLKCLKPLDILSVRQLAASHRASFCFEDSIPEASCSQQIHHDLKMYLPNTRFYGYALPRNIVGQGSVQELLAENRMDAASIARIVKEVLCET